MRHAALLAALLMAVHAWTFWGAGPLDDDFICYRYALNLLAGDGLVFQPGELIEGFTNPLWVLLLAGALKLGIEPTFFSQVIGLLAAAVAAWAVGDTWRTRHGESCLSPALLVAALGSGRFPALRRGHRAIGRALGDSSAASEAGPNR